MYSFREYLEERSPVGDLKAFLGSKVWAKEYASALQLMKKEKVSAADAARRYLHVDARKLQDLFDKSK